MKILITGDLVVNRSYNVKKQIDIGVMELFENSDFNIVNMEVPITESNSHLLKTGPHLKTTYKDSVGLNINIATLANNYLNYWSPLTFIKNRYIRATLRRLNINLINKKSLALFLNLIRCESHKDLSIEVIKKYLKK